MNATTTCSCGQARGTSAGIQACRCGRRYVVVRNGDVGTTTYAMNARRTAPGAIVKDGRLEKAR